MDGVSSLRSLINCYRSGRSPQFQENGSVKATVSFVANKVLGYDDLSQQVARLLSQRISTPKGMPTEPVDDRNRRVHDLAEELFIQYDQLPAETQGFVKETLHGVISALHRTQEKRREAFQELKSYVASLPEAKRPDWFASSSASLATIEMKHPNLISEALEKYDDLELARLALNAGANLSCHDGNGSTPLALLSLLICDGFVYDDEREAAALALAKQMITAGADPNQRNRPIDGSDPSLLPISHAASRRKLELAKILRDGGADLNPQMDDGDYLLTAFFKSEHDEAIRLLLVLGAKVTPQVLVQIVKVMESHGGIKELPLEMMQLLLELEFDLTLQDPDGSTLLHYFANEGSLEHCKLLVGAGLSLNKQNNSGDTPLHVAAAATREVDDAWAVEHGGRPKVTMYQPVLDASTVISLVEMGGDPMIQNNRGATVFHVLIEQINTDRTINQLRQEVKIHDLCAEHLVADRSGVTDAQGRTLIHAAVLNHGHRLTPDLIQVLSLAGVPIAAKDNANRTPLYYAVLRGDIDVLKMILSLQLIEEIPPDDDSLARAEQMYLAADRLFANLSDEKGDAKQGVDPQMLDQALAQFSRAVEVRDALLKARSEI